MSSLLASPIYALFAIALLVMAAIVLAGAALNRAFPRWRKVLKILGYVFLTPVVPLVVLVSGELTYFPPFTPSPHIFVQGESARGKFIIVGQSDGPAEWWIDLYWQPPGQPWAAYFLDGDADYWEYAQLIDQGDHLEIRYPDGWKTREANLDFTTGTLQRLDRGEIPIRLIVGSDPLSPNSVRIDEGGTDWPVAWVKFQQGLAAKN